MSDTYGKAALSESQAMNGIPSTRYANVQLALDSGLPVQVVTDESRTAKVTLAASTVMRALRRRKITNTNAAVTPSDISVTGSDVTVENIEVAGAHTDQAVYASAGVERLSLRRFKLTSPGSGVVTNVANLNDITISDSDITAEKYGVLINSGTKTSKGFRIVNSKISANRYDAVSFNNPTAQVGDAYDGPREVFVIGNKLSAQNTGTAINSGFSVGIANTREVVIIGNISDISRQEAVHIEDGQENTIVTGNIFRGCVTNGMKLLHNSDGEEPRPPIVTNNFFIKNDVSLKTDVGIWRVFDVTGSVPANFSNNYIKGFDIGFTLDGGNSPANVEGSIVDGCNTALKVGAGVRVLGTLYARNTPALVTAASGAIIERVVSETAMSSVLAYTGTANATGATVEKFSSISPSTAIPASTTTNVDLFPLPTRMYGRLTARGGSGTANVILTSEVTWDGTTLTSTDKLNRKAGALTIASFVQNGSNLALSIRSTSALTMTFRFDFDGMYYQGT
jgi:hypothetical protein